MIESAGPRCQYRVQQWRQEYGATMSRALRPTAAMILVGSVLVAPRPLGAEDYPNRYVRIITGGAGSFHDIVARRLAQGLGERWGQSVVIENQPAAGLTIGSTL